MQTFKMYYSFNTPPTILTLDNEHEACTRFFYSIQSHFISGRYPSFVTLVDENERTLATVKQDTTRLQHLMHDFDQGHSYTYAFSSNGVPQSDAIKVNGLDPYLHMFNLAWNIALGQSTSVVITADDDLKPLIEIDC